MAKTILIVDDSASLRTVVSIALKGAGYETLEAGNGKEALDKLGALAGKKVHLIVSDVNMPVMGGIEFVTKVKADPAFKFTPIVMLTTEGQDAAKEQGKRGRREGVDHEAVQSGADAQRRLEARAAIGGRERSFDVSGRAARASARRGSGGRRRR